MVLRHFAWVVMVVSWCASAAAQEHHGEAERARLETLRRECASSSASDESDEGVHAAFAALVDGHPEPRVLASAYVVLSDWLERHGATDDAIRSADLARRFGDDGAMPILERLDREGAVTHAYLRSAGEPSPAQPCDDAHHCSRIRRRRIGAVTWELVFRREPDMTEEGEAWLEAVTAAGRSQVARVGSGGGVGLAGTAYAVELLRMRPDHGVLRLEVRTTDEDYDWCEAYRETEDLTFVCGLEGTQPVCFARIVTRRHTWVGLGRIALDGIIDADDAEGCGLPRRLYEADEMMPDRPPWPTDRVEIGDGTLRVLGSSPWLRSPHTFAEIMAHTASRDERPSVRP
jgi:hypothetical protein